jgi:UDP-N-acetylglucosamine 4,6-dehydratase/5-epimerase
VTEDDSRSTVELPDRYVIEPQFHWWKRRSFAEDGAARVADGFRYASDTNTQWLDVDGLNRMLRDSGL